MSANFSGIRSVLPPVNEPIKSYAPGSPEKASLKARLASMAGETIDIPLVIGGVHCTMVPEEVTADAHFDYVCVGEGEYAFRDLVERIGRGAGGDRGRRIGPGTDHRADLEGLPHAQPHRGGGRRGCRRGTGARQPGSSFSRHGGRR